MRRTLIALATAAVAVGAAIAPAQAMTPGSASGIRTAIEDVNMIEDVRWVCRHRGWSSRRSCYYSRPYRSYRYYRPRYYRRW